MRFNKVVIAAAALFSTAVFAHPTSTKRQTTNPLSTLLTDIETAISSPSQTNILSAITDTVDIVLSILADPTSVVDSVGGVALNSVQVKSATSTASASPTSGVTSVSVPSATVPSLLGIDLKKRNGLLGLGVLGSLVGGLEGGGSGGSTSVGDVNATSIVSQLEQVASSITNLSSAVGTSNPLQSLVLVLAGALTQVASLLDPYAPGASYQVGNILGGL